MVLVLFAVSVLVFLIFNVIPGGDPESGSPARTRPARAARAIREEWGFDETSHPVRDTMEKLFSGELKSYANQGQRPRRDQRGAPRRSRWRSARRSSGSSSASRWASSPPARRRWSDRS
jgi:peptide/nickel transport system permease protein